MFTIFVSQKVSRTVTKSVFFMGSLLPKPETQILRFPGYTFLEHLFQDSQSVPTTNPVMSFFRGSFWVKKARSAVMISKRRNTFLSLVEGGYFKKKIQALSIEGLSSAEGDIIFKRVFLYVFDLFFWMVSWEKWLDFFRCGRFWCKETIHLKHLL